MPVEVTQEDREVVKALLEVDDELGEQIDAGLAFSEECEQVAAHRIAAEQRAVGEIVDWLREQGVAILGDGFAREETVISDTICGLADAIEAGEHREGEAT